MFSGPPRFTIDFATNPPTTMRSLQEISSVTVAVSILNHFNFNGGEFPQKLGKIFGQVNSAIHSLPLPKSISMNIAIFAETKIRKQIPEWVAYHKQSIIFENCLDDDLYCHIPDISWCFDGTIDYEQTARNLLSSIWLGSFEKYQLMCTYCFKDEMEAIIKEKNSLLFEENLTVLEEDFSSNPLICYWNYYFRVGLDKLPISIPMIEIGGERRKMSLDQLMFQHIRVNNWSAKEFFYNRLSSEEKVKAAITLIDRHKIQYQKIMLGKMNELERYNVYAQKPVEIMINYANTGTDFDDMLKTWLDFQNLIDRDQFTSIIDGLMRVLMFDDLETSRMRSHHQSYNLYDFGHHQSHKLYDFGHRESKQHREFDAILTRIWMDAKEDFKRHFLDYKRQNAIEDIVFLYMSVDRIDHSDFFFAILQNLNDDMKKEITKNKKFYNRCKKLLAQDKLSSLDRIIMECLPTQEAEQFKQNLVIDSNHVKRKCLNYYSRRSVDKVNHLLEILLPSHADIRRTYKSNLIMSLDGLEMCCNHLDPTEQFLDEIIKDCLPTEDLITQFKKKLIFSSFAVKLFQTWLRKNRLADVQHYVDSYLTTAEERTSYKKRHFNHFGERELVRIFIKNEDVACIRNILNWCLCLDDEEHVQQYKSTLRVDMIFDELLELAVRDCHHPKDSRPIVGFKPINRFIKWYFESSDFKKVKEYKLRRFNAYHADKDTKMLKILKMVERDDEHLKFAIDRFFNEEEEEMEIFAKKHFSGYFSS